MNDANQDNVITIPHGGITREQLNDANATLCDLLDRIEGVGVQNARITKADENAIRLCVCLLGFARNESTVITIPHGGLVGEGSQS